MRALALTLVLLAAAAPIPKNAQSPSHSTQDKSIIFWNMSRASVDMLLDKVPQPDTLRLALLKQIFTDLQCQAPRIREQPFAKGENLLCTLPGNPPAATPVTQRGIRPPQPGTILFIAHYEHEGPGQSAIEDWSGAIMLPFLYHALSAAPRQHTFLFAEVDGQAGSKALFNSFTPLERRDIKGVVALDALGLGPAQFCINRYDPFAQLARISLYPAFMQAAADQRIAAPENTAPGDWFKVDDIRESRLRNIPSILIHSDNWSTRHLPGSAIDTASAIDHDFYFSTLTLLSFYAAELDRLSVGQ